MGKDVNAVEAKLEKVVPREFKFDVHHWLILQVDTYVLPTNQSVVHVSLKICIS